MFAVTFATSFLMISTYHAYAVTCSGVASSWIINVFMSWLFIRVLLNRLRRAASVSLNARLTDLRPTAVLFALVTLRGLSVIVARLPAVVTLTMGLITVTVLLILLALLPGLAALTLLILILLTALTLVS